MDKYFVGYLLHTGSRLMECISSVIDVVAVTTLLPVLLLPIVGLFSHMQNTHSLNFLPNSNSSLIQPCGRRPNSTINDNKFVFREKFGMKVHPMTKFKFRYKSAI